MNIVTRNGRAWKGALSRKLGIAGAFLVEILATQFLGVRKSGVGIKVIGSALEMNNIARKGMV